MVEARWPATDQRGVARPLGTACDIGAYESVFVSTPTPSPSSTPIGQTPTLTPTPTPTPVPTDTPAPTETAPVSPTPTQGAGQLLAWGDVNCDGVVDAKDALYVLAFRAGITLPPIGGNCTPIGDQVT